VSEGRLTRRQNATFPFNASVNNVNPDQGIQTSEHSLSTINRDQPEPNPSSKSTTPSNQPLSETSGLFTLNELIAMKLMKSTSDSPPANNVVVSVISSETSMEVIDTTMVSAPLVGKSFHSSVDLNAMGTPLTLSLFVNDVSDLSVSKTTALDSALPTLPTPPSPTHSTSPTSATHSQPTPSRHAPLLSLTPAVTHRSPVPSVLPQPHANEGATSEFNGIACVGELMAKDQDQTIPFSEVTITSSPSLPTSRAEITFEMVRSALTSFWLPFLTVSAVHGTFVPLECVNACATQRWTAFIQTVCRPCCSEIQNVVRLSALAFGVRKVVSLKSNELCANVALYNPKVHDMAPIFRMRSIRLAAFLNLDISHQLCQNLLVEINKCWEGYTRCTAQPCALPTFKGFCFTRFPLKGWQDVLKLHMGAK
jgi:hypothetical protein